MEPIKFEELKPRIQKAIEDGFFAQQKEGEKSFVLIEGFFNQNFQKEYSDNVVLGGPNLPMIAIVGTTTGRVYFFALKAILKDL